MAASSAQPIARLRTSLPLSGASVAFPSAVIQTLTVLPAVSPGHTSARVVRVRPSRVTTRTSTG
ncbi:hypothetical protein O1157_31445 [Streptomyces albogriseolus]